MANKNTVNKKHSDHRVADVAKAGKRHRVVTPPSEKLEENKVKWVVTQVMNGIMTLDEAFAQVKPNQLTENTITDFLEHLSKKPDINPVVKMRVTRYL